MPDRNTNRHIIGATVATAVTLCGSLTFLLDNARSGIVTGIVATGAVVMTAALLK